MTYETPGREPVSFVTPPPKTDDDIVSYDTPSLSVEIMPLACTEKGSGQRFANSVFLTVEGEMRAGCGGIALAADSLDGTGWHFVEIAGEPVGLTGDMLRDDRYAIDFSADRFVGYGGCNRISAGYTRNRDILTVIPPWGQTAGRCTDPVMRREQSLLRILSAPVRVSFPESGTMVLTGDSGAIRLRRTR